MGGMLRYGIPQYRLPKEVLDKELALVEKLGVEFRNNIKSAEIFLLIRLIKNTTR